jgi:AcrR family transcriptional regulator
MSRPRALSHETVIAAAVAISDSEGLPALTVRRLAEALDVTGMTLYTYFDNKQELEQAVADALLERIPPPAPGARDPRRELGLERPRRDLVLRPREHEHRHVGQRPGAELRRDGCV